MTASPPGILKSFYYTWKSLRLPWRRRIFVGHDLSGNTFWEIPVSSQGRVRRVVAYKDVRRDLCDYELAPQWSQWLRHNRAPPTVRELEEDVARLEELRIRARIADEKWGRKSVEGGGKEGGKAGVGWR